jgi:protein involved in polysaccharide export with SLBB domain
MFKFNKSFAAAALAVASVVASAQDTNKSDLFNQEAPAAPTTQNASDSAFNSSTQNVSDSASNSSASNSSVSASEPARKMRITNGQVSELGANPQRSLLDRDAQRRLSDAQRRLGSAKQKNDQKNTIKEPAEFQKFIAENGGELLPIFGSEFFANTPSTFAPVSNAPIPSDYPLGPGDELMIRGWGTIDIDYRATIDRNGMVSIPTVGSIPLAGVKAGDAQGVVRAAIGRLYKGVTVSVTFGQLRAITVYVVGQANRPGTYTMSSLSTLVTALFASGGPNANGSMRHVQVKRGGKAVAELDLYSFIAKGDKSADIKLLDGDTIYIPPVGGYVALIGKVNSPAIYELKTGDESIGSLLNVAGGLPVVADPRRAFLERIDPNKNRPRSVEEFALNAEGLKRTLKNGDVLNVISITPDFSNAVILRGNVDQPLRAPFKPGMRVTDLIPSREYLITRSSIVRQNSLVTEEKDENNAKENSGSIVSHIGGLIEEINWDYAVIERIDRATLSTHLIPFNLGNVFAHPDGRDNVELQPGDTVTIFSQNDVAVPMEKRQVFVRVEGEVNVPGVYQMSAGDTLQSLLAKAGGPTANAYLFGTAFYREQVRKEQEANLEKIALRLETQLRTEQSQVVANSRSADAAAIEARRQSELAAGREAINRIRQLKPTGRIAFGLDPNDKSFAHLPQIKLESGDRLVVPARPTFVSVLGAVNAEASSLWRPNSRVKDYLQVTGVSTEADVDNTFVLRTDGTVVANSSRGWFSGGIGGLEVMPGDVIVVPEKFDKESAWSKFTQGTREWTQILANFGLGAAAIKTLRN